VQLDYQIALQGRADLPLAPDAYAGFLMSLLRMIAFRIEGMDAPQQRSAAPAKKGAAAASTPRRAAPSGAARGAEAKSGDAWTELVGRLAVTGAARELARHAALQRCDEGVYELAIPKSKASLAERAYQDKLKAALEAHLGRKVALKVTVGETNGASVAAREVEARDARQADATRAVEQDRFVKELVDLFDGRVVESTIRAAPGDGK